MPFTKKQVRDELAAKGVNPDEYDLSGLPDDPAEQPISQGRAALVTGRRAIAPVLGGAAGWGLGLALAPETAGISLLAPLAGSLLGGYGAGVAQEKILEGVEGQEEYNKGLAEIEQAREKYPVTSFVAGTAPMLLTGRPSLAEFGRTGIKGLVKGAGINAISDVASQKLLEGNENIDWGRVGLSSAVGSVFNKPQLLGNIGMPKQAPAINPRSGDINNYPPDITIPKGRRLGNVQPQGDVINLPNRVISPEYRKPAGLLGMGEVNQPQPQLIKPANETLLGKLLMAGDPIIDVEASIIPGESPRTKPNVGGGKISFDRPIEPNNQGIVEQSSYAPENPVAPKIVNPKLKTAADITAKPGKGLYQHESALYRPATAKIKQELGLNDNEVLELVKQKDIVGMRDVLERALKRVGIKKRFNQAGSHNEAVEAGIDEGLNSILEKLPIEDARLELTGRAFQAQSAFEGLKANPEFQKFTNDLAKKHNVKLEEVTNLKDDKGNPVAGVAYIQERLAQWNPEKAGLDTGLHEIGHVFADDLKVAEPEFYKKGIEAFENNEEKLIQGVGARSAEKVKAIVDKAYHKQALQWLQEFWSGIKNKWLEASPDDYVRLFSKKMLKGGISNKQPSGDFGARYYGTFPAFGKFPAMRMYNLNKPVHDPVTGEMLHTVNSTVSENTLKKYGISYPTDPVYQPTPEFRKWFGNSKIVDEKGQPKVVYHGSHTGKDITEFKKDLRGRTDLGRHGKAYYFTDDISHASEYASGEKGDVLHTYLKMEKPLEFDGSKESVVDALRRITGNKQLKISPTGDISENLTNLIKKYGYDGVVEHNAKYWGGSRDLFTVFEPTQIKSVKNQGTFDPNNSNIFYQHEPATLNNESPREDNPITARFNPFSSVLDKIAVKYGPMGKYVAEAFNNFEAVKTDLQGKFEVELLQPLRKLLRKSPSTWLYGTSPELNNIDRYMQDMFIDGKSSINLSPEEQAIVKNIRDGLVNAHTEQRQDGPMVRSVDPDTGKIILRAPEDNPNYYPNKISSQVFDVLTRKPTSPEAQKLKEDFIAFKTKQYHGNTQIAEESFNRIFQRRGSEVNPDFNAVRMEEGVGLPESWRDKNIINNLETYADKFSNDLAFYRAVQKDPANRQLLNIADDGRGNTVKATNLPSGEPINSIDLSLTPEMQSVMRQITRQYTPTDAVINSITKVVKANLMQTLTGLKDVVTAPLISFELLNPNELPLILKAYGGIAEGYKAGLRRGVIKPNQVLWQDHISTTNKTVDTANNLARIINKVTGRDSLEHFSRAHLMRLGQLVSEGRIGANDTQFLNKFGPKNWQELISQGRIEDVRDFAAARFVESTQGTYGIKGLPIASQEGILSPFLSLAKWPIERFNNWEKNVIMPARRGDIKPLLMSTLGAVLGGVAIEELTKLISGRKPQELTWDEYLGLNGQDTPYKLAALASYSGYAGIVGDLTKSMMDLSYGNRARGLSFPLYDMFATGFKRVGQATEAMRSGEQGVLPAFIEQTLKDNVQLWRIASSYTEEGKDNLDRANKFRDLRTFNRLEGYPQGSYSEANPFVGIQERSYKRSSDLKEAIRNQQQLVKEIQTKYQDQPELLKSKLSGLKQNSYQTIPSMTNMPVKAKAYIDFIRKTQGSDKANNLIQDYLRQNAINKMKSLTVPSI